MCLICVDLAKQKLKPAEARRALGEMREKVGAEHAREVEQQIRDAEEKQD